MLTHDHIKVVAVSASIIQLRIFEKEYIRNILLQNGEDNDGKRRKYHVKDRDYPRVEQGLAAEAVVERVEELDQRESDLESY